MIDMGQGGKTVIEARAEYEAEELLQGRRADARQKSRCKAEEPM